MSFKQIDVKQLSENAISLFDDSWALITAGNEKDGFNTMTASWGGIGKLWGKNVCFIFIRPQRHTYKFTEKYNTFTVGFFDDKYKKELTFCGRHSGADTDKMAATGFSPIFVDDTTAIEQSKIILSCKKLAYQDIDPKGFVDENVQKNYAEFDYHRVYIGEIVNCYVEE